MPLHIPGSLQLGPRPSSGPSTLVEYLESIGKDSWYGIYEAGYEMYANSDGSGGAVADGGAVGCWGPREQVSFNYKFIQATAASRPLYSTTLSAIGPTISGNGSSWRSYLNSTTALNLNCTILLHYENSNTEGYIFSQSGDNWCVYGRANNKPDTYYANSIEIGDSLARAESASSTGTWTRNRKLAISSGASTARYNNAPFIFARSSGAYHASRISNIAFVPTLTASECAKALEFV